MSYTTTTDYLHRVYAGVLGKLVGVYLGRPFEGWEHARIERELGEVDGYVNHRMALAGKSALPIVVSDDDISGTFTFLRALEDHGHAPDLTPAQIGHTWLNYIVENRTILWWGGVGNSTEHTAYARLKRGIQAPASGSIALNGQVVAEQIGSQIFIDGWGMLFPGEPDRAADFARRAASVSHDGEAIYGAQVVAAMIAQAFVERDLDKLHDVALSLIPPDSVTARLIQDARGWYDRTNDWRVARRWLERDYGYARYGGNCHIVPNHGVIHLALLFGQDESPAYNFRNALMIANTSGWDTDCNSGNVGCLLGVLHGLDALHGPTDWRGPVADRLYLPTADGGRTITDAARESISVVNSARGLRAQQPLRFKSGARFHFELPGSVQGFQPHFDLNPEGLQLSVINVEGHSTDGARSLALRFERLSADRSARYSTATWLPTDALKMPGYDVLASPTLYPGQTVRARISADIANAAPIEARLFVQTYGAGDVLIPQSGIAVALDPGAGGELRWPIPDFNGDPIASIGVELTSAGATSGAAFLDYLTWGGEPDVTLRPGSGTLWQRAWVQAADHVQSFWPGQRELRVLNDDGPGLVITGTREWRNYSIRTTLTPHLCEDIAVCARVQGLRRYYMLRLTRANQCQLVRVYDDQETVLSECACMLAFGQAFLFSLDVKGDQIIGRIDGTCVVRATDDTLRDGGIAIRVSDGRVATSSVRVKPS
jgi:ADP-ribosylglycohydrolase